MKKKTVFLIILAAVLILLIAIAVIWTVGGRPPKAVPSTEPFTGTVNRREGLSMTVEAGSVTPTSATLVIHNKTGKQLSGGNYTKLRIHVLQDGRWYPMELRTDREALPGVPPTGVVFPATSTPLTLDVSWDAFIGRLEPGHYRIGWSFSVQEDNGKTSTSLLAAEFDIN